MSDGRSVRQRSTLHILGLALLNDETMLHHTSTGPADRVSDPRTSGYLRLQLLSGESQIHDSKQTGTTGK
jgi:hypothetical protein